MTRRYLVTGQVQGVGFRYFVQREARALGLWGWVSNLPDGRVELVAGGPEAALECLAIAVRRGPAMARVSHVETSDISDEVSQPNSFIIK